jgi:hypothetical protein
MLTGPGLGRLKIVPDFLPRPEDLVFREEGVKVTSSVDFFKDEARRHKTQYQRMIRRLLDAYADHHSRHRATPATRARTKAGHAGACIVDGRDPEGGTAGRIWHRAGTEGILGRGQRWLPSTSTSSRICTLVVALRSR